MGNFRQKMFEQDREVFLACTCIHKTLKHIGIGDSRRGTVVFQVINAVVSKERKDYSHLEKLVLAFLGSLAK